ncbi:MAG TPA: adenylate/guanylate cyclase domain-containing protein [Pyrinomonadaceae bacterium]
MDTPPNGVRIYFDPDEKKVEAGDSDTVLAASLRAGIPHAHACGGNARCSTCRVSVESGLEHCAPREERERALAERLHFSPEVRLACQTTVRGDVSVRRLVLDEEDVELTARMTAGSAPASLGEEKEIAILFADIRGFTSLSERLPPYDVIYVLNRYFNHMGRVISAHGGYIDNYMGDGLMALFGVDDPADAPLRAVRAGLGMIEEVGRLRPHFESLYDASFRIGVGVHYGEAIVGTVGATGKRRMTAIGDAVNFASRVEAANKEYDTELLVSAETYERVRGRVVAGREIARAVLKGKAGAHALYEVLGLSEGG